LGGKNKIRKTRRTTNKTYTNLKQWPKNRIALSTVVTTLIILVISVLLASAVSTFAVNVVTTRDQEESLTITRPHIYCNQTVAPETPSYAQATLMIVNTAGRDIVINNLAVRGQECSWNEKALGKAVLYCVTPDTLSTDMPYIYNFNITATSPTQNQVTLGSKTYAFTVASHEPILRAGYTMLLYIVNPDSITLNDIGLTCGITLHTARAMYYRETNIQTVGGS
jgi:hypothetical protein